MGASSFPSDPKIIIKHMEEYPLNIHLDYQDPNNPPVKGQELFVSGDNEAQLKDTANSTEFPIGIVLDVDAVDDGDTVTISSDVHAIIENAIAKGGAIAANTWVVPNGLVSSDSEPEYVAAASGDYAKCLVINGGALDENIRLLVMRQAVLIA